MPNFKLDENLPAEAAELFRNAGHDTMTVLEQALGGHEDGTIAARCREEQRVIVTLDLDFSDIRTYPPEDYPGIIVFRLKNQSKPSVVSVLQELMPLIIEEELAGKLWIVNEQSVRIRG